MIILSWKHLVQVCIFSIVEITKDIFEGGTVVTFNSNKVLGFPPGAQFSSQSQKDLEHLHLEFTYITEETLGDSSEGRTHTTGVRWAALF